MSGAQVSAKPPETATTVVFEITYKDLTFECVSFARLESHVHNDDLTVERQVTVNKTNERKAKTQAHEKEGIALTLYSLGGVVGILIAIYFMTL